MQSLAAALIFLACTAPLAAQHDQSYAGRQHREIKALSEAEIRAYLDGAGMGYALAAELNHYPGPRHVLELADPLELSAAQRARTEAIFDRMHAEAVRLGERVVEKEAELDRRFAAFDIDGRTLDELLRALAAVQAELRGVHLRTHLEMRELLSEEQIIRYDELRGYSGNDRHGHDHPRDGKCTNTHCENHR